MTRKLTALVIGVALLLAAAPAFAAWQRSSSAATAALPAVVPASAMVCPSCMPPRPQHRADGGRSRF